MRGRHPGTAIAVAGWDSPGVVPVRAAFPPRLARPAAASPPPLFLSPCRARTPPSGRIPWQEHPRRGDTSSRGPSGACGAPGADAGRKILRPSVSIPRRPFSRVPLGWRTPLRAPGGPPQGASHGLRFLSDLASVSSQRFQVLFHSPFGDLFIFPSRYLFAIGLLPVFSLRRDPPPALGCTPKQPDSPISSLAAASTWGPGRGFHPLWRAFPMQLGPRCRPSADLHATTPAPQGHKDSHAGLFPLQSPLLRESRLFSFPPLTKMLQFSG